MSFAEQVVVLAPGADLRGGDYRVVRCVRDGTGAVVSLRGRDGAERSARAVALGTSEVAQLENEVRRLKTLSHPSIPAVFDAFREGGWLFLVTERVEGRTAQELSSAGALPLDQALDLGIQVARVLDYLHRREPPILHRDLRPANLVVTAAQSVYVTGFGFARVASPESRRDTVTYGNPGYSPPEQLDPSGRTTPRSDVFSFGWTLGALLTGLQPGAPGLDRSPELLAQRVLDQHPSVGWLAGLLERATALDPARRPANGSEVLGLLLRGAGTSASVEARCRTCGAVVPSGRRFLCPSCASPLTASSGSSAPPGGLPDVPVVIAPIPQDGVKPILDVARARKALDPRTYDLVTASARLDFADDFAQLRCEATLRAFEPLPHQRSAALDVLRKKKGRALLADEVGLGKTIEALLVFAEYRARGLVRHVLILCPPTLMHQWREELHQKLGIHYQDIHLLDRQASISMTKRALKERLVSIAPHQRRGRPALRPEMFSGIEFDLVIVDEVHELLSQAHGRSKPKELANYALIKTLQKKFVLLLSATPIQRSIIDLYELVNLTRPGQLMTWEAFERRYVQGYEQRRDKTRVAKLRRGPELRALIEDVAVRNTRDRVMTEGRFPKRQAFTVPVTLRADERELYDAVRARLTLPDVARQRAVWSLDTADAAAAHPRALIDAVARQPGWEPVIAAARALAPPSKLEELIRTVDRFASEGHDRILVFARFPAAREEIAKALGRTHRTQWFPPRITNDRRVELLREFHRQGHVLVVDDSAAVGLNLQMCDVLVNYDLPWNPFLVEQRIGRIQRIGQRSDEVWIVNFRVPDTIDDVKLDVLQARLRMFEGVFGEAPTILGALQDELSLEDVFREMYLERDAERRRQRLEELSQSLEVARTAVEADEHESHDFFAKIGWER